MIQSKSKSSAKSTESDVNASNSERLFIALGKTDGIDEQMLIDFLYDETNIEKESFSEIKIFDTFSFFVVSADQAEIVLEIFRRKKRGKRSIVERAKGKERRKKEILIVVKFFPKWMGLRSVFFRQALVSLKNIHIQYSCL